ncbi:restriction endonuclease subunit S [Avibacterium avium]|uniref:restriction endonuclease subunit S n=1 Tax=Avibacterium avium TaxID=751 RepID=UPI003BF91262
MKNLKSYEEFSIGGGWGKEAEAQGLEKVAIIRGTDFEKIISSNFSTVPIRYETTRKISSRQLCEGDLIIEVSGGSASSKQRTGRCLYVTQEIITKLGGKVIPASFCKLLRLKKDEINPKFIYYQINNMHLTDEISLFEVQSTGICNFQFNLFLDEVFPALTDLKKQNKVVNILENLDKKITLNTQTNQTLEQIAQTIFKHWFIDFAPIHAKANALARGETTEQAELAAMACLSGKTVEKITALKTQDPTAYHQLQQTAAAFPSEFVETEMGEVPRGWEICSITDKRVCSIIKPKIHHFSGEKDYIATANVSQNNIVGELEKITFDNRPSRANMQPIIDSIWFAKMVGEHKAIMIDENDEFLLNNTILSTGFLGIKPQQYKKCFLYCFINSDKFTLLKNSLATGAVQIALNNTSFSSMHITLPNDNILEHFETKVSTLFSKIAASHRENKSLAETRELLLPKLLNGEIEL